MSIPVLLLAFQGWTRRWATEDAYITFRVVDQFLHGNGPNFNVGERIEAATSPLWMYVLALFKGVFSFIPLPWIAVLLGYALTLAGVVAAMRAASKLERARGHQGLLLPIGMLVFSCIAVVWDFTTSGLETGLVFAWLGVSFLGLTTRLDRVASGDGVTERRSPLKPLWVPIVLGLGPLVRPDLGVAMVLFLAAYLFTSRRSLVVVVQALAVGLAAPVLYQIFRMGYYGATVPNTAIAKEAGLTEWDRGWKYLLDTVGPYLLVVPAILIALLFVARSGLVRRVLPSRDGAPEDRDAAPAAGEHLDRLVIGAAPLAASALLALFVVKVGGDFMHGRLLLPALFCALIPVAVIALSDGMARWIQLALLVLLGGWCLAGLFSLGPPYDQRHLERGVPPPVNAEGVSASLFDTNTGVSDERAFWEVFAGRQNPVSLDDYANSAAYHDGDVHRQRSEAGLSYLWTTRFDRQRTLIVDPKTGVVTSLGNIGIFGYVAGNDVWVEDWAGLSDPVGARIELPVRGRPGHEKLLPEYYTVARWTAPDANETSNLTSARQVLSCGDVAELLRATDDPMSPGRFLSNLVQAPKLSAIRIPISPQAAVEQYCR